MKNKKSKANSGKICNINFTGNKIAKARKQNIILIGIFIAFSLLVFISAVAPNVKIASPANNSFLAVNNIFVNFSANETQSDLRNITFYLYNSTGSLNTSATDNLSLSVNLLNNTYGIVEGISATSTYSSTYAADNVRDSIFYSSGWVSTNGVLTNQNLTINFTFPQIFDTIDIFTGFVYDFSHSANNTNVYVSDDYSSWTQVGSTKSLFGTAPVQGQYDTINFTEQNKKYLRLEFKDNWGSPNFIAVDEVRVYRNKTDLANLTSITVTATDNALDSNINNTRNGHKIFFADNPTRWVTDDGVLGVFNVNITWNFISPKRVNSLEWFGGINDNYMPKDYSILVSSDGSSYTEISNGTFVGGTAKIERINFSEQETQYLRIRLKTGYQNTYLVAEKIKIIEVDDRYYTHNFTGLSDGAYKINATAYDIFKNAGSSETRNVTIDTTKPLLEFVSPTPANNSGVSNNFEINVSITETNLANVTYNWNGTNTTYELTNNASYFSGSAPNWAFNLTQTGLTAGNSYTYYVYVNDKAGSSNLTATRTILGNSDPTFISTVQFPNSLDALDPNVLINVTVNISDTDSNFDTAFLQWKNTSAAWGNATNVTMLNSTAKGAYTILNASFTPTYEANYSYRIWANDTSGASNTSSETNVSVFWDCTWTATSDLGSTAGWDENKRIGNIILNNTGDSSHSACSLDFRLTYDLSEGRIYFDNIYYKPSSTYTLTPGNNQNISVNASFLAEIKSEDVIISTNELLSRTNVSQRNTTATIVSNQAGPYLFQKITSNPESVYLTAGNFSLEAYIRNLMGATTVNANNTAYNVTFNWTLPSGITNVSGTYKANFTNITDSNLHYNNINVSFSSLTSMTSGVKTFYIYATGVNKTGDAIEEADGTTLLKKSVNITFLCYSTSDSVCVTSCGSANDPDCVTSSSTTTSGGGGGGGGGAGTISTVTGKSVAEYELVRGQEQKFELIIENPYLGYLENLEISVKGIRQDLIKIIPDKIERIEAGQSEDIVIEIASPAYFTEGHYDLEFLVTGNLITEEAKRPYLGRMKVDLFIIDIPRKEAESMLKESSKMFEQMNNSNMSLKKISGFYISLQNSFEERKFSEVKKNYDEIKTIYDNAFGSLELLEWFKKQIKKAEKNGVSVIETKKLMYLGQAAFERGDYESSIKRLEEARLTYALETKGEFNLFYVVKNNPLESFGVLLGAIFVTFSSSLMLRYRLYKRKLKNLEEEEKLLLELMKTVQRETFENSHFSMGAYREAMFQYETKLSQVIEDKIETETKLASLFKIRGRERALKGEKEKLYNLVKELQKDYLQKGKIETRVYENMLKIYSTRIVEIEEKLVYLEAKQILHKKYFPKKLKLGWWGI